MTFDKAAYWKNRQAGIRGQGLLPKLPEPTDEEKEKFLKEGEHIVGMGTGMTVMVNRKTARRKYTNHRAQSKTNPGSSEEQRAAIRARVKRKEAGEQARVAAKKAEMAERK